jgi:RNA-directed DNA polymerase
MDLWPPAKYKQEGAELGRDAEVISASLKQAHAAQKAGFPAILSLGHLAEHTDVPYEFLRQVVGRRVDPYRSFPVKKQPRGYRVICVPHPPLMRIQRWVQRFVLSHLTPHDSSYAYAKGCSPLRCARMHAGCRWLVKIDVRRFFESIDERQVYRVFRECGYQALLAFEMARLTTRVPEPPHRPRDRRRIIHEPARYKIAGYHARILGHLPQGAPTSPMLANLVMRPFDARTQAFADEYGLTYTRYSDDLTFSSSDDGFDRRKGFDFVVRIYGLMRSFGLEPKTSKTNIVPPGARRVVLGLTVNDDRPRLTREMRRALECHVHFVSKLGYVVHARERHFDSALGCFRYVNGLIAYACQVDPEFGARLKDQISKIPPPF